MGYLNTLSTQWTITLILCGFIGLIIGSFLNVVITRYPIMLDRTWRRECQFYLTLPVESFPTFNLFTPRSHCLHCKKTISFRYNIPIISYFILRSRCHYCNGKITLLYPIVEILSATLTVIIIAYFGISWHAFTAIVLAYSLIVLSIIDYQQHILPDSITLTLLWLGMLLSTTGLYIDPTSAILGAIIGYLALWFVATLYSLIRHQQGMGHGDFKMLAMLGAWFGYQALAAIILFAVIFALATSLTLLTNNKITKTDAIPFGPFLAVSGFIMLLFGKAITSWMTLWIGL